MNADRGEKYLVRISHLGVARASATELWRRRDAGTEQAIERWDAAWGRWTLERRTTWDELAAEPDVAAAVPGEIRRRMREIVARSQDAPPPIS